MLTYILERFQADADRWDQEAAARRERTANDPGADALVSCARDLRATAAAIAEETRLLSPEQFAELHHVVPQSVTGWCRKGLLPGAERTPSGWRIPRDAAPPRFERHERHERHKKAG